MNVRAEPQEPTAEAETEKANRCQSQFYPGCLVAERYVHEMIEMAHCQPAKDSKRDAPRA